MSVASSTASDDDSLLKSVNHMLEPELRAVLQHISLLHPEVVHAALKHQQFLCGVDDVHSVITVPVSNTSRSRRDDSPPLIRSGIHGITHPSKRGSVDVDDDVMKLQPPKGGSSLLQRTGTSEADNQSPIVPLRRPSSPPPLSHEESSARAPAPPRKHDYHPPLSS